MVSVANLEDVRVWKEGLDDCDASWMSPEASHSNDHDGVCDDDDLSISSAGSASARSASRESPERGELKQNEPIEAKTDAEIRSHSYRGSTSVLTNAPITPSEQQTRSATSTPTNNPKRDSSLVMALKRHMVHGPKQAPVASSIPDKRKSFATKLYRMLEDAEDKGFDDIVSWHSAGTSFQVHDVAKFTKNILPKYFLKQTKYKSFLRQLSMYEFWRVKSGSRKGLRGHENFVRGRPDLIQTMKPVIRKSKDAETPQPWTVSPSSANTRHAKRSVVTLAAPSMPKLSESVRVTRARKQAPEVTKSEADSVTSFNYPTYSSFHGTDISDCLHNDQDVAKGIRGIDAFPCLQETSSYLPTPTELDHLITSKSEDENGEEENSSLDGSLDAESHSSVPQGYIANHNGFSSAQYRF